MPNSEYELIITPYKDRYQLFLKHRGSEILVLETYDKDLLTSCIIAILEAIDERLELAVQKAIKEIKESTKTQEIPKQQNDCYFR